MNALRYGSVCSGIEAATVAWHQLGWEPAWFAEIDTFPSKVLAHRFPQVRNHGDFTGITAADGFGVDLLVGGTPCQSFSVAGLRGGLSDERGNLALEFLRLADRCAPRWVVWENVPGVLSSNGGRDFGSFLGALGELGYGWAYRILDAQFFGVPQRRRRVFVVGHLGDWRRAGAVLFERAGVSGDPSPRRAPGAQVARDLSSGAGSTIGDAGWEAVAKTLTAHPGGRYDADTETFVAHPVESVTGAVAHTLRAVRRLTPRECERLQGFPENWTAIPGAADSPRYRAIGNSMAVPVMRWIGERIQAVHSCEASS